MADFAYVVCADKKEMLHQLEKLSQVNYSKSVVVKPGPLKPEKIYQKMAPGDVFVATSVRVLCLREKALYNFLEELLSTDRGFHFIEDGLDSRLKKGRQFMDELRQRYAPQPVVEEVAGVDGGKEQEPKEADLQDKDQGKGDAASKPQKKPRISEWKIQQIIDLYREGKYTLKEIADKVGVSVSTVRKYSERSEEHFLTLRQRVALEQEALRRKMDNP